MDGLTKFSVACGAVALVCFSIVLVSVLAKCVA